MSKEKTKTNNKFKIATIILAVALVVAVGGIFGVYAATQQNVQTSFSVTYSIGENVAVAIGANSTPYGGSSTWFTSDVGTKKSNNLYEIYANMSNANPKLTGGDIVDNGSGIALSFYFENISDVKLKIALTSTIVPNNYMVNIIKGVVSTTEKNPFNSMSDNTFTGYLDSSVPIEVNAGEIVCVAFLLDPSDYNKSATFETTDTTGISFNIQQA